MRQCQYKINVYFFYFFPTGVFHGNNYDILCCSFLLFSHKVSEVFAQASNIQILVFNGTILSIQCSSSPRGVLHYKSDDHLDMSWQPPP
jgi:hypothetical protein